MIRTVEALSLDTVVVRSASPLSAPIDGELALLDPAQGRYFGLDQTGHRIWQLIEEPRSIMALCRVLGSEFDVGAETCRAEVLSFLARLEESDLLVRA